MKWQQAQTQSSRHHQLTPIHYQYAGDGPAVVLLNGLTRTTEHWLDFDNALTANFRVIKIDLRGAGHAPAPCPWSLTIKDMAQDVIDVLDHLGIDGAHILGVSLGGMVALGCGIAHPARCRSLTPINSSIGSKRTPKPRLSRAACSQIVRSLLSRPDRQEFNRLITDLVVSVDCTEEKRREIAARLTEISRRQGLPNGGNALKQLLAASRFYPENELQRLTVPTLIIQGSHDKFVPPINSNVLAAAIPQAQLETIEGGGHELMFDKPEELIACFTGWLNQLPQDRQVCV
jgi:pimeloyl-ACP methyl ester carboxylesterase